VVYYDQISDNWRSVNEASNLRSIQLGDICSFVLAELRDLGVIPAMGQETELKFKVPSERLAELRSQIGSDGVFAGYSLSPPSRKIHVDTYFDSNGKLRSLQWSLRVRTAQGSITLTLKRPILNTPDSNELVREELQNNDNNDLPDVLLAIGRHLADSEVIAPDTDLSRIDVIRDGLIPSLARLGLHALFDIETDRQTWILSDGSDDIAEIALDESTYATSRGSRLAEGQLEIELLENKHSGLLTALGDAATAQLGLEPTRTTKYQRGLNFYFSADLREKVEAKIVLPNPDDFYKVSRAFSKDPSLVPGYRISQSSIDHNIEDVYYDTTSYILWRTNCYARIRRENGRVEFTFRGITDREEAALPVQEELKTREDAPDFPQVWERVRKYLIAHAPPQPRRTQGDTRKSIDTSIEGRLRELDLHPTLQVRIERTAWIVQAVDDGRFGQIGTNSTPQVTERIAKIKFDRVTFLDPTDPKNSERHLEFEVTGLEDELAAPSAVYAKAFQAFLFSLSLLFECTLQTGSKYAKGLQAIGAVSGRSAPSAPGIALVRSPVDSSKTLPERAQYGIVKLGAFLALSATSLILILLANDLQGVEERLLVLGPYISGGLILLIDRSMLITRTIRIALTTLVGIFLAGLSWGLGPVADVTALIGFPLTVIGLLALNFSHRGRG
jgi:adenylate cyclase class IV